MEILNTTVEGPNIWLIILGIALILFAIFVLFRAIHYLRWKTNATAFFFFLGFVALLSIGIAVLRNNIGQNNTIYDVMVKDEDELQKMKEDYDILKQSGIIYTVRPKKELSDFVEEKVDELNAKDFTNTDK